TGNRPAGADNAAAGKHPADADAAAEARKGPSGQGGSKGKGGGHGRGDRHHAGPGKGKDRNRNKDKDKTPDKPKAPAKQPGNPGISVVDPGGCPTQGKIQVKICHCALGNLLNCQTVGNGTGHSGAGHAADCCCTNADGSANADCDCTGQGTSCCKKTGSNCGNKNQCCDPAVSCVDIDQTTQVGGCCPANLPHWDGSKCVVCRLGASYNNCGTNSDPCKQNYCDTSADGNNACKVRNLSGTSCNGTGCCDAGVCKTSDTICNGRCGRIKDSCGHIFECDRCPDGYECIETVCTPKVVCDSTTCPNGCCTAAGACVPYVDQGVDQCGTGGALCAGCDDSKVCTTDTCSMGVCVHTPIVGCCTLDSECNDGNACTTDACNPTTHTCTHTNLTGVACGTDNNGCCSAGICNDKLKVCSYDGTSICCDSSQVCTHDQTGPTCCTPQTVADCPTNFCGVISDGCGGTVTCSACPPPDAALCQTAATCNPGTGVGPGVCTYGSTCAATETCCAGACKDLQTDPSNCGTCGTSCNDDLTCTTDSCVSGVCRHSTNTGFKLCTNDANGKSICCSATDDCIIVGTDPACSQKVICDSSTCPNGCCTTAGACVPYVDQGVDRCGTGGATCGTCATNQSCNNGICVDTCGSCTTGFYTKNTCVVP
ncbi:MAG: hypothetical protein ACKOWF_01015, partial [Chloroflexota bacterium]